MTHTRDDCRTDGPSDNELLAAYRRDPEGRAGRHAASELFGRYRSRLYAWCYRRMENQEDALDLAQEVLLEAFRGLPRFEGRSQFSSWLYAIARNRCINARRARTLPVVRKDPSETTPSDQPDPLEELIGQQHEAGVLAVMEQVLDPLESQAIWLSACDVPVDEITRLLALNERSGARGLLQRARRKLRAAIPPTARSSGEES